MTGFGEGQGRQPASAGWQGRLTTLFLMLSYLVGKDGHVIQFFPSKTAPDSPELREAIEKALAN
jgi:hypothetical protein